VTGVSYQTSSPWIAVAAGRLFKPVMEKAEAQAAVGRHTAPWAAEQTPRTSSAAAQSTMR